MKRLIIWILGKESHKNVEKKHIIYSSNQLIKNTVLIVL